MKPLNALMRRAENSKHRTVKHFVRCTLVFASLFLMSSGVNAASNIQSFDSRMEDLRREIAELTRQAAQYRQSVLERQSDAKSLTREVSIINDQIRKLQAELSATQKEIDLTSLEIGDVSKKIEATSDDIESGKAAIGEAMRVIDSREHMPVVAMLFSSESIAEFAQETKQINDLGTHLSDLVRELKYKHNALEEARIALGSKQSQLEQLKSKGLNQKGSLEDSYDDKNHLLAVTKGEEKKFKQLLNATEKKQSEFIAELEQLEKQALKSNALLVDIKVDRLPPKGTKLFDYPYSDFRLTQTYGYSSYARSGAYGGRPHSGIDIVAGYGSPIRSIGPGTVIASGANNPGWGNWVAVHHPATDFVSLYAHMRAPTHLSVGTPVDNSVVIGYEGATGNATGSHLHLCLYARYFTYVNPKNGLLYFNYIDGTVNPLDYIK